MIYLDFLQNPPLDDLCLKPRAFESIAHDANSESLKVFREKIAKFFNKQFALPFCFESCGFIELFLQFEHIFYMPSAHYFIRRAVEAFPKKCEKIPIHRAEISQCAGKTLIIAPYINEDIFSFNEIISDQTATLALDVSYALALGLDISALKADIFLINGAPLGLLGGMIISDKIYVSELFKNGLSEAFWRAICARKDRFRVLDSNNMKLFEKLKQLLGKDIELFAQNFAPHTLPLRFKHINTRHLIEHLYLEDIFIHSSQDCALGFIKPSHTLSELGFGALKARELCAITFDEIDTDLVASKLAQSYQMIRLMEF